MSTYYEQLPGHSAPALILHAQLPWLACLQNRTDDIERNIVVWERAGQDIPILVESHYGVYLAVAKTILYDRESRRPGPYWIISSKELRHPTGAVCRLACEAAPLDVLGMAKRGLRRRRGIRATQQMRCRLLLP